MAEFGINQGLAVDMGYDKRVNDLRFHEQQNQRALAENQAKQALFAEDLDYQNASNSRDHALIKDYATKTIKEIGSYVRENPDWETNLDKRMQVKAMKKSLKDNQYTINGLASDTAYKNYVGDLQEVAKNPQQHDTGAYDDIQNQWNNYLNYGNQGGAEAAAKEGTKAFIYTKPKDFIDINKSFVDAGTKFNDVVAGKLKGGGMGSYEEYANPESLKTVAIQMYSQNKKQFDKLAAEKGLDPIKYIETGINAYIPKKRDFGDYSLAKEKAMLDYKTKIDKINTGQEYPEANSYKIDIVDKNHSFVSPEQIRELVDGDSPAFLFDNKSNNKIDLTGSVTPKQTGYNFYPDPEGKDLSLRGKKYAESYAYVPVDKATELGILDENSEVKSEWKNNVSIESKEISGTEKASKVVKVKLFQPFDVNTSSHAGKFNAKSMTTKQRPMPKENYQSNKPKTIVQDGYTYTLNEKTGQYE